MDSRELIRVNLNWEKQMSEQVIVGDILRGGRRDGVSGKAREA